MELDFGTKFTLHLWFTLGVRGIFGQLLVSLVSLFFCDYFVELLREWWCQNQTSKHYRANRFYDSFLAHNVAAPCSVYWLTSCETESAPGGSLDPLTLLPFHQSLIL